MPLIPRLPDHACLAAPARGRWRGRIAVLTAFCMAGCQTLPDHPTPPPENASLPKPLQVAPEDVPQEVLDVHGQEVYACTHGATGLAWADRGSEATLVDAEHNTVGLITSGHYFIGDDNSSFYANVVGESSMSPDALAWQLVRPPLDPGRQTSSGRFGRVSAVQRVQTSGGLPPSPDCRIDGAALYVPFSAVYMLYRRPTPPPPRPSVTIRVIDPLEARVPRRRIATKAHSKPPAGSATASAAGRRHARASVSSGLKHGKAKPMPASTLPDVAVGSDGFAPLPTN